jgi:hypothetical protein
MALFRRTRRVPLRAYEDPPVVEPAAVERVIEEGVLIAASAVRMAVKNRLIVLALRDKTDWDPGALAEMARIEFVTLASHNDDSAKRVWRDGNWDDEPDDGIEHMRRRDIFRGLANALRTAAEDRDALDEIVDRARDDALSEVSTVVSARLVEEIPSAQLDPDYEADRANRLKALIDEDLATLNELRHYRDLLE